MLQRIYGTAFDSEEALEEFLRLREEAERRDHRRLGPELELFSIREEIGPGLVIYHPNGADPANGHRGLPESRARQKRGYELVISPHIMRRDVWETSGHLSMQYPMYFFEIEGQGYGIKPMNCPAHIYIYKSRTRGHNELPDKVFRAWNRLSSRAFRRTARAFAGPRFHAGRCAHILHHGPGRGGDKRRRAGLRSRSSGLSALPPSAIALSHKT